MTCKIFFTVFFGLSVTSAIAQEQALEMNKESIVMDTQIQGLELKIVPPSPVWCRYLSLNISSFANRTGIVGIGIRKENSIHGVDIGLNPGSGTVTSQILGHASYLYRFLMTTDSACYAGLGAQGGCVWRKKKNRFANNLKLISAPRYTIGRSFISGLKHTQFIEINVNWPIAFHFKNQFNHNRLYYNAQQFSYQVFYGLLF